MDIQKLMNQARAMQNSLAEIEEELNASEYTGNSGGAEGVFVTINGKNEVALIVRRLAKASTLLSVNEPPILGDIISMYRADVSTISSNVDLILLIFFSLEIAGNRSSSLTNGFLEFQ